MFLTFASIHVLNHYRVEVGCFSCLDEFLRFLNLNPEHCGELSSCSVFLVISRDCLPFESNVSRAETRFSWGFREMSVIHRDSLDITCNNDRCDIGDLSVGLEESIGIVLRTYFLRCSETKKVTSILSLDIYK